MHPMIQNRNEDEQKSQPMETSHGGVGGVNGPKRTQRRGRGKGAGAQGEDEALVNSPVEEQEGQLPFTPVVGESVRAFEAFLCYFDIGTNRSLPKISEVTGISTPTVRRWCREYGWQDRVRAFNVSLLRARVAAMTAAQAQLATHWLERHTQLRHEEWALHADCIHAGRVALEHFLASLEERRATLVEIVRIFELASKLGRLATGAPTDRTEVTAEVTATLDPEWELALKKVYGTTADAQPVIEAPVK